MSGSATQNIRLYPLYRCGADAMAWLPIFFLYFSERLSLSQVLILESVYYIAVVITEVPSGYLSDIAGRKRTLLLSSFALILAYLFFLISDQFAGLAIGQALLAISIAFRSGTDTSFHYESLAAVEREEEYGDREATAGKYGFISTAAAALAGGVLGSIDLVYPYYLSLATACLTTLLVFSFTEPAQSAKKTEGTGLTGQIIECLGYLKLAPLMWLWMYYIMMFALVHIPYELYQPYLALLDSAGQLAGFSAPLAAGILFALTASVAAFTSAYSMQWRRKFGLLKLLTWASVVELAIIGAMAVALHPIIAMSVILRSGPMAVVAAPINAASVPLIKDRHRATYLSLQSLSARLVFSAILFGFALLTPSQTQANWSSLSLLLRVSVVGGLFALCSLYILARRLGRTSDLFPDPTSHDPTR